MRQNAHGSEITSYPLFECPVVRFFAFSCALSKVRPAETASGYSHCSSRRITLDSIVPKKLNVGRAAGYYYP